MGNILKVKLRKYYTATRPRIWRPTTISIIRAQALAGDTIGEPLLKSLWLGRLSNSTQTILTALKEDLAGLASVADKISDLANHSNINAIPPSTSDNRITTLEQQVAQLTTLVGELTTTLRQSRSPNRNPNRPSKTRCSCSYDRLRKYKEPANSICFYHTNIGTEAKKCNLPCSFKNLEN